MYNKEIIQEGHPELVLGSLPGKILQGFLGLNYLFYFDYITPLRNHRFRFPRMGGT